MKLFNSLPGKQNFVKFKLSAIVSQCCVAILSLMGYSCSSSFADMYGTPTGSFEIKGCVTNEEGEPIKEALIRVTPKGEDSGLWSISRSVTNESGFYKVADKSFPVKEMKIVCLPPGNRYEPDSIIIPMTYTFDKDHKKDSWYEGHATATVDFKLKPKGE